MNDLLFFPGSQEYVAAGRIPFMWAQSLYVISQLLKDSFIACGELDPINRRLSSLQRPEVIVQVVVLAKDEKIKDLLNQVKHLNTYVIENMYICRLWQYGLWSFQTGGTKLGRFLSMNQHTQRKLLNFENWTNGEPQELAKIRGFKIDYFDFSYIKLEKQV